MYKIREKVVLQSGRNGLSKVRKGMGANRLLLLPRHVCTVLCSPLSRSLQVSKLSAKFIVRSLSLSLLVRIYYTPYIIYI